MTGSKTSRQCTHAEAAATSVQKSCDFRPSPTGESIDYELNGTDNQENGLVEFYGEGSIWTDIVIVEKILPP
jgi:hypothetical protein